MDFIRLIHPQLLGLAIFLVVLWVIFAFLKKYVFENIADIVKPAKKVVLVITFIAVFVFLIMAIKVASVNETPRSVIDRSTVNKNIDKFEKNMREKSKESKNDSSDTLNAEKKER